MVLSWLITNDPIQIVQRNLLVSELTFLVLLLNLVVLFFYTKYARRMQQEVAKQVEAAQAQTSELIYQRKLSVMPAFNVFPTAKGGKHALELQNVGNGVAIHVFGIRGRTKQNS